MLWPVFHIGERFHILFLYMQTWKAFVFLNLDLDRLHFKVENTNRFQVTTKAFNFARNIQIPDIRSFSS